MKRLAALLATAVTLAAASVQVARAQPTCPSYDQYNHNEQRCVTHHEHGEAH